MGTDFRTVEASNWRACAFSSSSDLRESKGISGSVKDRAAGGMLFCACLDEGPLCAVMTVSRQTATNAIATKMACRREERRRATRDSIYGCLLVAAVRTEAGKFLAWKELR